MVKEGKGLERSQQFYGRTPYTLGWLPQVYNYLFFSLSTKT